MMNFSSRIRSASRASGLHLLSSLAVVLLAAVVVFVLFYPYPYRELSGGRELFLLIVVVDVVCGPLLTLVLFNPAKPSKELWRDLGMVALIQIAALLYGMWTVWLARPMYLALEVDRFKVVMATDLDQAALDALPANLQPYPFGGVRVVALRRPISVEEKNRVLFSTMSGGKDYAERPEFYTEYEGEAALKSLARAKPIEPFLQKYPDQRPELEKLAKTEGAKWADWRLLPVQGRQDWVALLDAKGQIKGYLKGDNF